MVRLQKIGVPDQPTHLRTLIGIDVLSLIYIINVQEKLYALIPNSFALGHVE